jgi:hypothetical protein
MFKEKLLDAPLEDILEDLKKRPPRIAGTILEKKIAKDQDKRPRPKIYAIDFDGTIVEDAFPDIGALKEDAKFFINKVREKGDKWILWTVRTKEHLINALRFLDENNLLPDTVNTNVPEAIEFLGEDSRKIYADYYIDDKSSGGLKWPEI